MTTQLSNSNEMLEQDQAFNDIYAELVALYGPMMDLGEVAKLMKRNRNSIRYAITKVESSDSLDKNVKHQDWAVNLTNCKTQIGKKIMFRTRSVAEMLSSSRGI